MKRNNAIGILLCLLLSVNVYAGFGGSSSGSKSTSTTTAKSTVSFKAATVSDKSPTTSLSQRADSTRMQSKAASVYQDSTKPKVTASTYTVPTYSASKVKTAAVTPVSTTTNTARRDTSSVYRERSRSRDTSDSGNDALLDFVAGVALSAAADYAIDEYQESEAREAKQREVELARLAARTPEEAIAEENRRVETDKARAEAMLNVNKEADKHAESSTGLFGFVFFFIICTVGFLIWTSSPIMSRRRRSTMS